MPKLNTLQIPKVGSSGLINPNALSQTSVGVGTLRTPSAAKPVYNQFVAQDANLPLQIGRKAANLGEAISKRALVNAKLQGKATGQSLAADLRTEMEGKYFGTADNPNGIAYKERLEFVEGSLAWEKEYNSRIDSIASSLDAHARSEFLTEAMKFRNSQFGTARTKRISEHKAYVESSRSVVNGANSDKLVAELSDVQLNLKSADLVEKNVRLSSWASEFTAEFTRRFQDTQDPAVIENLALEVLTKVYQRPEGHLLADLVETELLGYITSSELKEKALGLRSAYIQRDIDAYQKSVQLDEVREKYKAQEAYDRIASSISSYSNEAQARDYAFELRKLNPAEGDLADGLIKSKFMDKPPTIGAYKLETEAIERGLSRVETIKLGNARGVVLSPGQLEKVGASYKQQYADTLKNYNLRLKSEIKSMMSKTLSMTDRIQSMVLGDPDTSGIIAGLQSDWYDIALRARKEGQPLDQAFEAFLNTKLNPQIFKHPKLKWSPSDSRVPSGVGVFGGLELSTCKTYADLVNQIDIQDNSAEAEKVAYNGTTVSRLQFLTSLANSVDATGNPAHRKVFWNQYKELQKTSFRDHAPNSMIPRAWMTDLTKQVFSLQTNMDSYGLEYTGK